MLAHAVHPDSVYLQSDRQVLINDRLRGFGDLHETLHHLPDVDTPNWSKILWQQLLLAEYA